MQSNRKKEKRNKRQGKIDPKKTQKVRNAEVDKGKRRDRQSDRRRKQTIEKALSLSSSNR